MKPPRDWLQKRIEQEPYWFHKIDLGDGLITPGWSDPKKDKLPHFGLPADLTGMRVLDIGTAEGFFAFEAERRGAAEVVAIDAFPPCQVRFELCRQALESRCTFQSRSVYELSPSTMGTFDLVMCFGLLYHLRHPLLALDRIRSVCTKQLLLQTMARPIGDPSPKALFHKNGVMSGPNQDIHDPSVFFVPNTRWVLDLIENAGFINVEALQLDTSPVGVVASAAVPEMRKGCSPPTPTPWS